MLPRKASRRPGVVLGTGIIAVLGTRTEQPQSRFLSSGASPSPGGPKPAGQGRQSLALAPLRVEGASSCCAVACACVTNLRSEHLFVLFLLSPLHLPLSVCQNTNGPLLGPCHLVSIRVTLGTASLLDLCAQSERGSRGPSNPVFVPGGMWSHLAFSPPGQRRLLWFPGGHAPALGSPGGGKCG